MIFLPSFRAARFFLTATAAFALASPAALFGLDATKSVFQYNCRNWSRQSGLPADNIRSITQTSDGFIWLGTQNGLVRFDGLDFTTTPIDLPEARGSSIADLHPAADGGLWFSIAMGGFGHFDGRTFRPISDPRWSQEGVGGNTILEATDGSIWTGSVFGVGHWSPQKPAATFFEETFQSVMLLLEDTRGRIWAGTAEHGLRYYENGRWSDLPDDELLTRNIPALAITPDGDLWVGTNRGLRHYTPAGAFREEFLSDHVINALLVDDHGALWVGTNAGLSRIHDGTFQTLRQASGLGSDHITSLFEDNEGSLWVGTQEGLSLLTDLKFPIYSSTEGIGAGSTRTVSPSRRGGLWITTDTGFSYFDGQHATNYSDPALLPNPYGRRSFEASNGDIYITDGNRNINVIADGRLLRRFTTDLWPEAFAEDAAGVIVGVGGDLMRFDAGQLVPYSFLGDTPPFGWINNLLVARDGALWAATNNGLYRIEHGRARAWTTANGLPSNRVHYLLEDEDGTIWVGFPGELIRVKDDRIKRITPENGLHDGRIYAIVADDHGYFWFASGRGFFRVSRQSLNDFADEKTRRIQCDAFDGLEAVKFSDRTDQGFSGCKTADGRIWFPNPRGVVMIDPQNFFVNGVAPPVNIQRVRVQGADLDQHITTLQVGDDRIEFDFVALSYISPHKVRIRYQLDGHDTGWVDAADRRFASYNNLSPGDYVFRVQAANADGVWNDTGDTFAFVLPPPFYQRLWFYGACGLLVAGSAFGGFRWKVRNLRHAELRLRTENDLLETKVRERTDELAHSLSLLKATLDSTADGILAVQFTGAVVCNRQFSEMWQLPPEALTNDGALRDMTAAKVKDPEKFLARVAEVYASREKEFFDLIELKDGRFIERYCKPQRVDGRNVGIVINFRDITQRRLAEEALRSSESFLNSLVENLPVNIYRKDRHGRITFANHLYCARHDRTPEAIRGRTVFDLLPHSEARRIQAIDREVMTTGRPYEATEPQTMPSGELRFVQIIKVPLLHADGSCIGLQGMFLDVTEAKLAEQRLAEASSLLEAMLDNTPDFIYFKDRKSRFVRVSRALLARFPNTSRPGEITDFDLFANEHAQKAFNDEQEIIRTGVPMVGMPERETHVDGRVTWALTTKLAWRAPNGAIIGTFGISKNITALKEAETRLAEVHRQLLDTSRQAGMAEVATGVLHNVGNVLNSVNVSATLIVDQVRESKTTNLAKLAAMLCEHSENLSSFLTDDPKGRRIPNYLATLSTELCAEQKAIVDELEYLRKNIEHIKDIVAMQQSYAKVSGVVEPVALAALADDALRINASALDRRGLEVVRDYQAQPVVSVERHKVLHILVNLIRNAKYACDESNRPDKRIVIRIEQNPERVTISVIDNGVGITRENLTRIFAHGFTTRKEGHGFGLHSGALAAREMGGSLRAASDGAGLGATFTLDLPASLQPPSP